MSLLRVRYDESIAARPPEAFLRALKSYRLGMAGLTTRSSKAFAIIIPELEQHGIFQAKALAMAGLVARAGCAWESAARLLSQAAEKSSALNDTNGAAISLALATDAFCASGLIAEAQRGLESWSSRSGRESGLTDLSNVVLHLARGNLVEAVQLAATVVRTNASPDQVAWASLFELEGRLDQGKPLEVEKSVAALETRMDGATEFNELWVRGCSLIARWAVETNWAASTAVADTQRARKAVQTAMDCSVGFKKYHASAMALSAQLLDMHQPGDGAPVFQKAVAALEANGCRLELGLALARRASFLNTQSKGTLRPVIAQGRDLLTRIGAETRSQLLAGVEGGTSDEGALSAMTSRSIMGRSMMGGIAAGDDVELQAVFKVNAAISSILELDELLQKVLDEVVRVLKAERGVIVRRERDGTLRCVAARGILPEKVREGGDEVSFSVFREVERTGQVTLTDNAQLDERFRGQASVMAGEIRSLMCAPLKTQKELHGFLYIDSTLKARVFKDTHRELLGVFATQAAVAIEKAVAFGEVEDLNANLEKKVAERTADLTQTNAALASKIEELTQTRVRLLEAQNEAIHKELQIARRIQESILPTRELVQRPGVSLIGRVEAATEVGGDFWSPLTLPDGTTLVIVGDATGHGLGPGILTTVAKACCDTVVRDKGKIQLGDLLPILSDVLYESSKGELTMTAFAILVDPAARTLVYANCGHVLPLYIEAAGGLPRMTVLTGAGKVLGRTRGLTFDTKSRSYVPGDRILLFTDGLTECSDAKGVEFGPQRLSRVALETATMPLPDQLARIFETAHAFWGEHPRADDVTAVLLGLEEVVASTPGQ